MALVTCWLEVHPASLLQNQTSHHRLSKFLGLVPLRVPSILMNMVHLIVTSHSQTFTYLIIVPVYNGRERNFNMQQLHILNRSLTVLPVSFLAPPLQLYLMTFSNRRLLQNLTAHQSNMWYDMLMNLWWP